MDLNSLYTSFNYIAPEITIAVALIMIVIFDLIFDKNKKIIPYIAYLGIFSALFFVAANFNLTGTNYKVSSLNESMGMISTDTFGSFFKILILVSSALIIFFSKTSEEIKKTFERAGEYYALIFGMILGMMFMVTASDLILIYLSVELLSLSSYVLAGFTKLRDRNAEASLKYLIYGAVASGLMLFGISLVYGMVGSTNLAALNNYLQLPLANVLTFTAAAVLIFAGIGYKISAAPFHFWTPDVYEGAPISITAYLSVASKAAGFALLIRLIRIGFVRFIDGDGNWHISGIFDWQSFIIIISILTMTLGNFSALWQNNLKRMLAYSSIAHAGYILLGVAVLSNHGLMAVMVYFFIYMIMNIGAFFVVMLIADKTGSEDIDDYNGMGYRTPLLGVALTVFLISLTGLPPTGGFIAKLYLFIALVDANLIFVAVIALLNSVVSLYYYVRVLKHMYLTRSDKDDLLFEISLSNKFFVTGLAALILLLGIYFTPLLDLVKNVSFFTL
ncbi:MAG: NADH-quinone oxidoreductase subunit N [Bacteroidetes bacterium]|nr:NADH-quinone oxidoreductase subunit N [Bacteroidota bacterium]MBU2505332.1 NADH-quinone oxidoreductase subunit N [Bacteroidota bacterium]